MQAILPQTPDQREGRGGSADCMGKNAEGMSDVVIRIWDAQDGRLTSSGKSWKNANTGVVCSGLATRGTNSRSGAREGAVEVITSQVGCVTSP